jgi:TolB-like protein/Tfp pilus assembly protein PilF
MNGPPSYQRFFAEMKRRRVFRVMAVYGAVTFGVVQIADLAFPRLGMPEWTVTLVLLLSLLGFPIAIVLSWAFETTPEGLQRTREAHDDEIQALTSAPASKRWPAGLAAAAGGGLLVIAAWMGLGRPGAAAPDAGFDSDAPVESIAVLPFADMSPDGSQAYFGDGLAEELLDALANVEGLRVAARTSSFRFRGADVVIPDVAKQLDVQTVLEGSVRSGGGRVRITAQLVSANGFHVWSDSYDRSVDEMADLIRVQEEIAQSIVATLALAPDTAAGEALETLVAQGTDNLEAYNAVLRGRHLMAQRTPAGLSGAVEQFEKAVALDPEYARAWADLSMAASLSVGWGYEERDGERERRGKEAAERALALDPRMAEAHTSQGYIHSWIDHDSAAAQQAFARAAELDPRFPTSYHWRGEILSDRGHAESGIPYLEKARELDPLSPIILVDLGEAYDRAGRWYEADTLLASAMELEPEFPPALQGLVFHSIINGDAESALDYAFRLGTAREDTGSYHVLWTSLRLGKHEVVRSEFRKFAPADTATVPENLTGTLLPVLYALNEFEGPGSVRSLVTAQAPRRMAAGDSITAIAMRGYAAAVSGDDAAARSVLERLAAAEPEAARMRVSIALALGDTETALNALEVWVEMASELPGTFQLMVRMNLERDPVFEPIRDTPRFRAIIDELGPFLGPAVQGR